MDSYAIQAAKRAEAIVGIAVDAASKSERECEIALGRLPAAVYATDTEGRITYFNRACVTLAGRLPTVGVDRWCVTWRLYTNDGAPLRHEDCPMATAVKEKRSVRGVEAVAERPDGTRIPMLPFPTPVFDEGGELAGAVNVLIDMSARADVERLRVKAARCRRLARTIDDTSAAGTLSLMAQEYEAEARALMETGQTLSA